MAHRLNLGRNIVDCNNPFEGGGRNSASLNSYHAIHHKKVAVVPACYLISYTYEEEVCIIGQQSVSVLRFC